MLNKAATMQFDSRYHVTENQIKSEFELIKEAQADSRKFEGLYNKYYEQIYRFIFQRIGDKEASFDVVSDVFIKALQSLHKYEYRGVPFSSWLYRIAQNELNTLFRKSKAQRTVRVTSDHLYNLIEEVEEETTHEYHDQVLIYIKQLNEEDLQLIEMRFFEKRAFQEIAEIMGKKESAVKMKLYRVLEKIKKAITAKS